MPKAPKTYKDSPFSPGTPVAPEYFVGRQKQIQEIMQRAYSSSVGKQQHIFVTGHRAIGKTSLAQYVLGPSKKIYSPY